jgi:hypothetical protein
VQDVGLIGANDEAVLGWAAASGRILLTHDVTTITLWANRRIAKGEVMPGVFVTARSLAVGQAIDDLILLAECSEPDEWAGSILYLPLQ